MTGAGKKAEAKEPPAPVFFGCFVVLAIGWLVWALTEQRPPQPRRSTETLLPGISDLSRFPEDTASFTQLSEEEHSQIRAHFSTWPLKRPADLERLSVPRQREALAAGLRVIQGR